jgi:hypothetical protein
MSSSGMATALALSLFLFAALLFCGFAMNEAPTPEVYEASMQDETVIVAKKGDILLVTAVSDVSEVSVVSESSDFEVMKIDERTMQIVLPKTNVTLKDKYDNTLVIIVEPTK